MSTDQTTNTKPSQPQPPEDSHSPDYAPYPKLDPIDVAPPPPPPQPQHEPQPHQNLTSQQPLNSPSGAAESRAPISGDAATTMPQESNPYVSPAPVPAATSKSQFFFFFFFFFWVLLSLVLSTTVLWAQSYVLCCADTLDSVKDVLGRWGKKAAEATKKAEDLAGNMWQHCMCYLWFMINQKIFFFLNRSGSVESFVNISYFIYVLSSVVMASVGPQ